MSQLIHYTNCPACGSSSLKSILTAKDYTVSNELFTIVECTDCTLRFTQDVPDSNSIGPYYKSENYISHSNTSKGFINNLYQSIRKKTLKQKRKLIEKTTGLKTGKLLDVGSGTGAFASEMKQAGWQVTGLEPDEDARKVAVQINNVELNNINLFYELPENNFDAITMWHVLEHVHDLQGYIAKLKSILKENGMKLLQYKPMWYDSFYVSMLSCKYKNGKINLIASFFNGLRSNSKAIGNAQRCSSVIYIISK